VINMYIDINDVDLNNDYFHFSNIENIDSISRVILSKPMGDIVKASVRRVKLSTV